MSVIHMDAENVGQYGYRGVDMLTPEDELVIYYSAPYCNKIRKEYLDQIEASGCRMRTCKLLNGGKDYLDRYIDTAVGECYANGEKEIGIVSKDHGYQAVIDYYKVMKVEDLRIVKRDDVESILVAFGSKAGIERRRKIQERSALIDLDEYSARLAERNTISNKIKEALARSPYWYRTKDVCDFVENRKFDDHRSMYTESLKNFGRAEGLAIYKILKKVV